MTRRVLVPGVTDTESDVTGGVLVMRVTCEVTIKVTSTIEIATDTSMSLAKLRTSASDEVRGWFNTCLRERPSDGEKPSMTGPTVSADAVRVEFL